MVDKGKLGIKIKPCFEVIEFMIILFIISFYVFYVL